MSAKLSPESTKTLVDFYEGFLRVGRVSSEEWAALDDDERACLLVAQKRIDVERALMIAMALNGPRQLMSEVDGGESLVRAVTEAAVDRYIRRVS